MTADRACRSRPRGFTLTELAVVIFILALLIGGTVATFQAQNAAREVNDTQRTVELAREAILGFAIRNGRLPCPAIGGSNGEERFCVEAAAPGPCTVTAVVQTHGRCAMQHGLVPAATLGIGPIEPDATNVAYGALIDSWLEPVRYSVTQMDSAAPVVTRPFTSAGGMKQIVLGTPPLVPDLRVCSFAALGQPTPDVACPAGATSIPAPALIFSRGRNRSAAGVMNDEAENGDADLIFVAREATATATQAGFDDILIPVSANILYNRLISAGAF